MAPSQTRGPMVSVACFTAASLKPNRVRVTALQPLQTPVLCYFHFMDKMFAPIYFPHPSHGKPKTRYLPDHLICENNLFLLPDVLFLTHLNKRIRDTRCRCFCFSMQDSRVGQADELAINYIICVD